MFIIRLSSRFALAIVVFAAMATSVSAPVQAQAQAQTRPQTPAVAAAPIAAPSRDAATLVPAQANVIYGMFSGLALLMDVYRPAQSNQIGIVLIPGSGWGAPLDLSARPLKDDIATVRQIVARLLDARYTVFVIDHRASPRFHYPDQVDDARRAVRFIRHHAADYGIDAARLAGLGYSSGANLAMLLAVQPDEHSASSADPVSAESGRLQCVVAAAAPADLTHPTSQPGAQILSAYLGLPVTSNSAQDAEAAKRLAAASPVTYVTADDAPMLFVHGTDDPIVPIDTVRAMASRLTAAGVPVKLLEVRGGGHWPLDGPGAPDLAGETLAWLTQCFRGAPSP